MVGSPCERSPSGTDAQLEVVEAYVTHPDSIFKPDTVCDLCHSLGLWGRLSAVDAIMFAYDRHSGWQCAEGLPAYLTTMLDDDFGPAADYPRDDSVEAFEAYESAVRALVAERMAELGGATTYALHGGPFSVRRLAERMLELLGRGRYQNMMQPFLRQRFEACTGIDCSSWYVDSDFQPLTAAAMLEEWLHSGAPDRFAPGERYFFGHRIPRG